MTAIAGHVDERFARVAEAFEANFRQGGDLGASFAASVDGRVVVDLWGGTADPGVGRPWGRDTLQMAFSGTKALVAICILHLIERDRLDLDEPVATYWPEFARRGKERLTVADVLSHRCALPAVENALTYDDLSDGRRLARLLADQATRPDVQAPVYHPLTYGWLCGELVQRVTGASVGEYFDREFATPFDLDIWIGLPPSLHGRVATTVYGSEWRTEGRTQDELGSLIWENPPIFPMDEVIWNRPSLLQAEVPATNGVASARSMARLFGMLCGGGEISAPPLRPETVALGLTELSAFREPSTGESLRFGAGFALQSPDRPFGPPTVAAGHLGAGGSVHGFWPDLGTGFSYCMNELRSSYGPDPRAQRLLAALHECLITGRSVTSGIA